MATVNTTIMVMTSYPFFDDGSCTSYVAVCA